MPVHRSLPALLATLASLTATAAAVAAPPNVIRAADVTQSGDRKIAIVGSATSLVGQPFTLTDVNHKVAYTSKLSKAPGDPAPFAFAARANFTTVTKPGTYQLQAAGIAAVPV